MQYNTIQYLSYYLTLGNKSNKYYKWYFNWQNLNLDHNMIFQSWK